MTGDYTKLIIGLIFGTVLGTTTTFMMGVASNRTDIAVLSTKIENLTTHVTESLDDPYQGSDAAKDHLIMNNKLNAMDIILKAHLELDKQLDAEFRAHVAYCENRDRS